MIKWILDVFNSYLITWLPCVVVFSSSLFNPADSDLGWHLKYGEYFFKYGQLLRENILSTQMAGYHWVNHSWITDIVTYGIFHKLGFFGLSIAASLIITLTFYFIAKSAHISFWGKAILFPILIFLEEPLFIISFRSQLFSILGTSILVYILSQYERGKQKYLLLFIPLFFIWANIHGGFLLGFILAGIWLTVYFSLNLFNHIHQKLSVKKFIFPVIVLLNSVAATLINPFGTGIYQESLRHFGNPLQKYIIEWTPLEAYSSLWWILAGWGVVLILSICVIIRKKRLQQNLPLIIMTILLYILSFWMRRYAWTMYLVSIPVVWELVKTLIPPNKKLQMILPTFGLCAVYVYVLLYKNSSLSFPTMSWNRFCRESAECSPASAKFLQGLQYNPDKLLTFYNWGGWIIWNYPDIKPSIDGRMPFWRDERGYSAFADYYVLEQDLASVDTSNYDTVWMPPTKPIYKQMTRLVQEGKWNEVYKDEYASVFIRITELPTR